MVDCVNNDEMLCFVVKMYENVLFPVNGKV
jgi:hypothetical protein